MTFTYDDLRMLTDMISDHVEDWQGIPVPLEDMPVRLHDRHPLAELFRSFEKPTDDAPTEYDDDEVVNHWVSRAAQKEVWVCRRKSDGRPYALTMRLAPDQSMQRLTFWVMTIGVSDAWDLAAERKARFKLAEMLTERQWRHYDLTGSFFETSQRSGITYVFRRLRPTIAMTPRWRWRDDDDSHGMRCLAVLCLHPIGYYQESWGGCMVPTDDVIAHLTMMRGDEPYFWAKANQHEPHSPEAGI